MYSQCGECMGWYEEDEKEVLVCPTCVSMKEVMDRLEKDDA